MPEIKNFDHIRGIIWDMDGTLYRYNDLFKQACNIAAARTAIDLGLNMSFDDALALATNSEKEHGNSFKNFAAHGLSYEDFHHPFHKTIDETILDKNREMVSLLEQLSLPMVILTNASRLWAERTIAHIELSHLFPSSRILGLEDADYAAKAHSTKGFKKAAAVLDIAHYNHILMVEDLPRNLMKAKELGMTTAFVRHGRADGDADHADHVFDDTVQLVQTLLSEK